MYTPELVFAVAVTVLLAGLFFCDAERDRLTGFAEFQAEVLRQLAAALELPERALVLNFDSPGGYVNSIKELNAMSWGELTCTPTAETCRPVVCPQYEPVIKVCKFCCIVYDINKPHTCQTGG